MPGNSPGQSKLKSRQFQLTESARGEVFKFEEEAVVAGEGVEGGEAEIFFYSVEFGQEGEVGDFVEFGGGERGGG